MYAIRSYYDIGNSIFEAITFEKPAFAISLDNSEIYDFESAEKGDRITSYNVCYTKLLRVTEHFGHCEGFNIFNAENGKITESEFVPNPGHRPGFLPVFRNNFV